MDQSIQRALNDKLYDKRKVGALDLERVIRDLTAAKEFDKIKKIIQQLCNDYAYAVHQPHARNGGLIGLAAAAIALGPDLARYLDEIVPPVLACFTDQDARVRYYACESMYNIAKVAKGADSELSVKNGAELLDRLIKDIVSESAATYVSILHTSDDSMSDSNKENLEDSDDLPTAFSLARFIPLLKERIYVINPFTRTFLVGWITLLDSIPDLELVSFLPEFLGGLFKFLSDPNRDVHVATQGAIERFLSEIKRISRIKKGIEESRKSRSDTKRKRSGSMDSEGSTAPDLGGDDDSGMDVDDKDISSDDDWVPGQDVHVNHKEILVILTTNLDTPLEEDSLLESLRWIVEFLDICPEEVLPFAPKILAHLLPAMASGVDTIRQAAARVNTSLMAYVVSLSDEGGATSEVPSSAPSRFLAMKESNPTERRDSSATNRGSLSGSRELDKRDIEVQTPPPPSSKAQTPTPPYQAHVDLDYAAAVSSLTLLFLNDHEVTRVEALNWLLMLHRKAPKKLLAFNDGIFPALLKTLSDPSEAVVTKDLQLLSQISRNSDDDYFTSFMVNLLQLFSTDRKLLETRGNLIIRQLCINLSAERIYRTLADCIEKEEDVEFASIMVQNLNNNLITAPELADLRKRLRNIENKDGQAFFVALFRSWCYNAVATFSLCLLGQAYEQAYNLLQIFAELEMTVNMLIQIDKLVQLLESPVFTYLRLQLLEPEKYPHLYKCLYGLLMLLPQSSAFAALKNRLNSVSAIGYLHIAPRAYVPSSSRNNSVVDAFSTFAFHQRQKSGTETHSSSPSFSVQTTAGPSNYDRSSRLKGREESGIRWGELLDKFRIVQERARRARRPGGDMDDGLSGFESRMESGDSRGFKDSTRLSGPSPISKEAPSGIPSGPQHTKSRSSLGKFGRLGGAVAGGRPRK
ncbi:similar to vacuole-associated enzyme activator complex component (Vac14) [Botrytis cinerea T4]|uniref:Similar to vacuole-associated enzyme activator complex component (Vac14) n=1 Tax=Botryotinia fuckeliana (strain T4) TaxID=999810 RepID=G2YVY9_BOTF4|nr:similar to vacuole-associated enzyme activator complex component (Vac14) [Botrytis cinerea T4]